ncbi:hypothetical protein P175DRAFT_0173597 [Aspergillus ochraceoroseus IBT 24754]|uniref:Uncharacterized protein n=1 Tax=Aspergillus ochraceoroseus IBT 24754 TaxID=1392256 RepID=A0A2T5M4L3_9EURO|nr:uncharacterized protein P175DRAFT_0173597 [Aspergillus ochraceoroseus IBT 24754]PTU23469.1 hypothetical protein P175DRAFT_0173597 [Aspergillus ochraceoroseus IBT 24754]
MDAEPSVSRDPRVSSRLQNSLSVRSNSQEQLRSCSVPSPHPSTGSQETTSDHFIRGISDLVQTAVFAATSRSERERLHKKRGTTDELLSKARGHSGFPSTVEFFQKAKHDEDVDLVRIEKKIKEYESNYQRLESELRARWLASASQPSKVKEKIPQLQQDVHLANTRISSLQSDVAKLQSLEKEVDILHGTISAHQKSFASYTNSLGVQDRVLKDNSNKIEQLERDIKNNAFDTLETLSSECKSMADESKQNIAAWGEKIELLWQARHAYSTFSDKIHGNMEAYQQKLEDLSKPQTADPNPKLASSIQALSDRLGELEKVLSIKDDLQFAEMEDIKKSLEEFKTSNEQISKSSIEGKVNTMHLHMQHMRQNIHSVNTGLRSLESRYNSLSTEPIVKQMVAAMQEMYPSVDYLSAGLEMQTRRVNQQLPPLQHKVQQLEAQVQGSIITHNELTQLQSERNDLSQSVGSLWERLNTQAQWLNQEEFNTIKSNLGQLAGISNTVVDELKSKKAADEKFLQELAIERNSFQGQLSMLRDTIARLDTQLTQKPLGNDKAIQSPALPIENLETSIKDHHQQLREQIQEFTETGEPTEPLANERGVTSALETSDTVQECNTDNPIPSQGGRVKRPHASTLSDDEKSLFVDSAPSLAVPEIVVPCAIRNQNNKRIRITSGDADIN